MNPFLVLFMMLSVGTSASSHDVPPILPLIGHKRKWDDVDDGEDEEGTQRSISLRGIPMEWVLCLSHNILPSFNHSKKKFYYKLQPGRPIYASDVMNNMNEVHFRSFFRFTSSEFVTLCAALRIPSEFKVHRG